MVSFFYAASVDLFRAKLITCFHDQYVLAKYSKSRVEGKFPEGITLFLERYPNVLFDSVV